MWWLIWLMFGGAFIYGFSRPRHTTINNYIEQDINVDCDGGSCDSGDSSYDSDNSNSD